MDIEEVINKYKDQLMQLRNVRGIGIGEKDGKKVVKVFVTYKIPENHMQSKDIVPKILEGWETDIIEITNVKTQQ